MHMRKRSWILYSAHTADNKQKVTRTTQGANDPATADTSGEMFAPVLTPSKNNPAQTFTKTPRSDGRYSGVVYCGKRVLFV